MAERVPAAGRAGHAALHVWLPGRHLPLFGCSLWGQERWVVVVLLQVKLGCRVDSSVGTSMGAAWTGSFV